MKRNEKKPLGCGICPYKTNSACHLERHLRIHTGHKPYACGTCDYRATDGGLLKRHMRIHSGEKPFICPICGHKTAQSCSLKDHMAVHTGKKRYSCDVCAFQCSRIGRLRDHQLQHKNSIATPEEKTTLPTDDEPRDAANNSTLCKCSYCGLEFSETSYLNRHLFTVHSAALACATPSSVPSSETTEKSYVCAFCAASEESLEELGNHISLHLLYKCLKCESFFESADELVTHGPIHSGENIFKCNICDFECKTRNELRGHERTHSNNQQFKCSSCSFVSRSFVEFSQHVITHTSKEMVQCNICLLKFGNTEELRDHMATHYNRVRTRPIRKIKSDFTVDPNAIGVSGYFSCYYCSYKSPDESAVESHIHDMHVAPKMSLERFQQDSSSKNRIDCETNANALATTSKGVPQQIKLGDFFSSPLISPVPFNQQSNAVFSELQRILWQPHSNNFVDEESDSSPDFNTMKRQLLYLWNMRYGPRYFDYLQLKPTGSAGEIRFHHTDDVRHFTDYIGNRNFLEPNRVHTLEMGVMQPSVTYVSSMDNNFGARKYQEMGLQTKLKEQMEKSNSSFKNEIESGNSSSQRSLSFGKTENLNDGLSIVMKEDIIVNKFLSVIQQAHNSYSNPDLPESTNERENIIASQKSCRNNESNPKETLRRSRCNEMMEDQLPKQNMQNMNDETCLALLEQNISTAVSKTDRKMNKPKARAIKRHVQTKSKEGAKRKCRRNDNNQIANQMENSTVDVEIVDESATSGTVAPPMIREGNGKLNETHFVSSSDMKMYNNKLATTSVRKAMKYIAEPKASSKECGHHSIGIENEITPAFSDGKLKRSITQLNERGEHAESDGDDIVSKAGTDHRSECQESTGTTACNSGVFSIQQDSGDAFLSKLRKFFKETLPTFNDSSCSISDSARCDGIDPNVSAIHTIELSSDDSSDI